MSKRYWVDPYNLMTDEQFHQAAAQSDMSHMVAVHFDNECDGSYRAMITGHTLETGEIRPACNGREELATRESETNQEADRRVQHVCLAMIALCSDNGRASHE